MTVSGNPDLSAIKYVRVQIGKGTVENYPDECHTAIEFVNGSRACSCGLERGDTPSLRTEESIVCTDPSNCDREHVGGMGGTPVHLPPGGIVRPGHFDVPVWGDDA